MPQSNEEIQKLKLAQHELTKKYNELMDEFNESNGDPDVAMELLKLFPHLLKAKRDYLQSIL